MITASLATRVGDLEERMDEHDEHHVRLEGKIDGLTEEVKGLRLDVIGLKHDVSGFKSDVSGLKSDVSGLKSDISGMKSDIAGLKTGQAMLQDTVNRLEAGHLEIRNMLAGQTGLLEQFGAYLAQKEGVDVKRLRQDPKDGKA